MSLHSATISLLIHFPFNCTFAGFRVVPVVVLDMAVAGIIEALFVLGQSYVTPLCMLYFSKDIRRRVKNLLRTAFEKITKRKCVKADGYKVFVINTV